MARDLLFTAGSILTMDPMRPRVEAIAVRDGRILAVGTMAEVTGRCDGLPERVDLHGGALLPAFIDAHHHYSLAALDRRAPDLHLAAGSSIEDLLARLQGYVQSPSGEWARAQGYDPQKLSERRAPSREQLDELCPQRPLLLIAYSCHEGVLNSAGLERMGFDAGSPDPPGGRLGRRRGRLTGELIEAPFFAAEARSRGALLQNSGEQWIADCEQHGHELLAAGIVRVGDAAVPPSLDALYERAAAAGKLPVKVHRMPVSEDSFIGARTKGPPTGDGPARAPIGAAKLFLDGADQCALCASPLGLARALAGTVARTRPGDFSALRAMTRMGRGWSLDHNLIAHHGISFWESGRLTASLFEAAANGLQVAQHAIGNEAITTALSALQSAAPALAGLPGAPRLEHAMFLDEALAERIAASGAIAVVNPHFIHDIGDELSVLALPGRLRAIPLNILLAAGVSLAGGSDYPVSSYNVLAALRAGATRHTESGRSFEPDQAITVGDLLRAYTHGAAHALGVEHEAGLLAPGHCADLVVLSADPLQLEPSRLPEIEVLRTYVDGRLAHPS